MPKFIDLTGQRFGKLIAIKFLSRENNQTWWLCRCDCGAELKTSTARLRNGQTKSCGCYNKEMSRLKNSIHGKSNTRLYRVWRSMVGRCKYPNIKSNKNYSGRGITICSEWEKDFNSFADWAYKAGYRENAKFDECTIDRIDTNGNYCPENCRWVNMKMQARNRRNNRLLTYNGETKTLTEWAEQFNINYSIIRERIDSLGWGVEEAITTPKLKYWNPRRKHI